MRRYTYTKYLFNSWQFALLHRNPYVIIKARMLWICTGHDTRIVHTGDRKMDKHP